MELCYDPEVIADSVAARREHARTVETSTHVLEIEMLMERFNPSAREQSNYEWAAWRNAITFYAARRAGDERTMNRLSHGDKDKFLRDHRNARNTIDVVRGHLNWPLRDYVKTICKSVEAANRHNYYVALDLVSTMESKGWDQEHSVQAIAAACVYAACRLLNEDHEIGHPGTATNDSELATLQIFFNAYQHVWENRRELVTAEVRCYGARLERLPEPSTLAKTSLASSTSGTCR